MGVKIGIDLGTTYSVVSYVDKTGTIRNIESAEGEKTTPSVVYFDPDGKTVVVGSTAREAGAMNPEGLVERVKNFMGDPAYRCYMNGQEYSAAAVSSLILQKLVNDAQEALGSEKIDGAVITCPAYFGDAAREATRQAGEAVALRDGSHLNVLKIMDEPTAASIAYGAAHPGDMQKTVLIYDLGGGTFDCTIMRFDFKGDDRQYQVVTTGGNHQLGGKDWDAALANYVRSEFCAMLGEDEESMENDPESRAWFSENIEKAKKQLSARPSTKLTPSFGGRKAQVEVTAEKFDELTEGLFNETISLIDQMCAKKGLDFDREVDEIILVGGSTRMPQVMRGLKARYNKPISTFDPDRAVSNGAALIASGLQATKKSERATLVDAKKVQGGATLATLFEDANGATNRVVELCTKSYALGVTTRYSDGTTKDRYINLVRKDTPKPAFGTTQAIFEDGNFVIAFEDTDEISVQLYENDSLEEEVPFEECVDLYEPTPVPLGRVIPGGEAAADELYVDESGQLTVIVRVLNTGEEYVVHPVRRGGNDTTMENVAGFTLA